MSKYIVLLLCWVFFPFFNSEAREFIVDVQADYSKLNDIMLRDNLSDLQQAVKNYIEQYQWTDDPTFESNKIELVISIFIEQASVNRVYTAQVFIGAKRKIYNSDQFTSIFRYLDGTVDFEYYQGNQLQHDEQTFHSLATLLDFYVYLILGIDADSYEPLGGSVYFTRAFKLASLGGSSSSMGWSVSNVGESKKQIIEEYQDVKYENFRKGFFKYHYDGLDALSFDQTLAFQNIIVGLRLISETMSKFPNSIWARQFFESKFIEIKDIFRNADRDTRLQVYTIVSKADPSHMTDYDQLLN